MSGKKNGRPPAYTADEIEAHKKSYLELLAQGKTEREIDKEFPDLPTHSYRNKWLSDENFKEQCQQARALGAEFNLQAALDKVDYVWEQAKLGSGNNHLVSLASEYMRHARWLASKHNKQVYGDKQSVELTGKDGKPIEYAGKPDAELNQRLLELAHKSGARGIIGTAGGETPPNSSE